MDTLTNLLTSLFSKLIEFVQWCFNQLFGDWNYGVLFNWLPADIQSAVSWLIMFLFCLAMLKFIRSFLPF